MSDNPIKDIVSKTNKPASTILEDELKGIVSNTTFYNLIDERGIPSKAQFGTINRVVKALGYRVVFQKVSDDA